jgi:hypothetical protein
MARKKKSLDYLATGQAVTYFFKTKKNMLKNPENGKLLPMVVTEGVTVNVLPNEQHEYLMGNREVASGYGVTEYAIRKNKLSLGGELLEGKHFVKGVTIGNTPTKQPNQVWWTKRGIIRLGFAMRTERAKLFRDWAEELIVRIDEMTEQGVAIVPKKALPKKRLINRLDRNRMVRLLAMTAKIDDHNLRNGIVDELLGGFNYDEKGGLL